MSFTINETKWGFYVTGTIPVSMISGLTSMVPNKKKALMLLDIADHLGATMVVANDESAAKAWREEIEAKLSAGFGEVMTPAKWRAGCDTGISSLTICNVMEGRTPRNGSAFGPCPPRDPSDFGRCYRLLRHFPEWRERLHEVAEQVPSFAPMIRRWDEMTALYEEELPSGRCPKLYDLMKQIEDEETPHA